MKQAGYNQDRRSHLPGSVILYSGHEHYLPPPPPPPPTTTTTTMQKGVASVLSREVQQALICWEPVYSRIISATFDTRDMNTKLNVVQCYAPTNDADDGTKKEFYEQLHHLNKLKPKDINILKSNVKDRC